jgi:hypothetical protein
MRPTMTYASVSILAFCAGTAVSFLTLPLWITFAINVAKEGNRTDWLSLFATIMGSLITGGVAATAIYFAWRAVMRQSRLTLVIREEDWITARLPGLRDAFELCQLVAIGSKFENPSAYSYIRNLFDKRFEFPFMGEALPSIERLLPRTNDETRKTISLLFNVVNAAAGSAEAVSKSNDQEMIDYQTKRLSDALEAVADYEGDLGERIRTFENRLPKLRSEIEEFFESKH